ncbi:MAG: DUF1353 domain-containing protein [Burkholderiaceae bacterium]
MNLRRRDLLKGTSALALAAPLGARTQDKKAEPYGDREAADKWLLQWLQAPGAVTGALHLGRFADRTYFTTKEIGWSPSGKQKSLPSVTVPAGFVTDLASIPRVFWSILPPDGRYTFPAIVHDYLYWTRTLKDREDADLVLKYGMEDMSVRALTVTAIHQAVRLGGGGPWDGNAALRKGGEKRLLVKYPDDPKTTWAEHKKRPGVLR